MAYNRHHLVELYDSVVGRAEDLKNPAWKGKHERFLMRELKTIFDAEDDGAEVTGMWRQYEELIETRGLPAEKGEYRNRKGNFEDIPSMADIAIIRFDKYMKDESKLENWQKLCRDLSFEVIPLTITQCRKVSLQLPSSRGCGMLTMVLAVKTVFVNIYTFLDGIEAGQPPPAIHRFPSFKALANWTKKHKKFFPKKKAKEAGALRGLLQPIVVGRKFGKKKEGFHMNLVNDFGGLTL